MRVLYFSQDYTLHDYRFLKKLAESPHEVWYLQFQANPITLERRPVPSGIKVVDWMGKRTYNLGGYGKLKLFRDFRRILHQLHPDLVHAGPVQNCGFFTALAGFRPMLVMSWGSDIMAKPDKGVLWRWITKFTIKRADMVACDCLAVRDKITGLTGYPVERIVIFPWGVDLNQFRPASSKLKLRDKLGWNNNKVVITTRSLEPIYGVEVLLEAARTVIEKEPDARFLMLGDGSLRPKVQTFIAQHNLEQTIYLTGRVPHEMLPDYFNEADLYVSGSYSDGTSVSLLEAMACELPVIVTDLPSNREWVHSGVNGWLVPPGDPEALGLTILEALEGEERTKAMGRANVPMIRQKADWNKNFDILLAAYERLSKGNGK